MATGRQTDPALGADPVRQDGARNADVPGFARLIWPKARSYGSDHHGALTGQAPDGFENVAYLVEAVRDRYGASRHSSRPLAGTIVLRFRQLEPLPAAVASTISLIATKYKVLKPPAVGHPAGE